MAVIRRVSRNGKVTWTAVVWLPDETGKKRQVWRAADTRAEAKRLESELIRRKHDGEAAPGTSQSLFSNFLKRWIEHQRTQGGLKPSTLVAYDQAVRDISEHLGSVAINRLAPMHLLAYRKTLADRGLSPSTQLKRHKIIHKILRDAMRWGVTYRNVSELVDAPRTDPYEPYVISSVELGRLFIAADKTVIGPLVRFLAWTGARLGEALALANADVRLGTGTGSVLIRQTLDTYGNLGQPKTKRSRRTIALSPNTVAMLAEMPHTGVWIFLDENGNQFTQSKVKAIWRVVRENAGVPLARLHDLRHHHASALLASGAPLPAVSERLGHADTSITARTYSHSLPLADLALAAKIDEVMR